MCSDLNLGIPRIDDKNDRFLEKWQQGSFLCQNAENTVLYNKHLREMHWMLLFLCKVCANDLDIDIYIYSPF